MHELAKYEVPSGRGDMIETYKSMDYTVSTTVSQKGMLSQQLEGTNIS